MSQVVRAKERHGGSVEVVVTSRNDRSTYNDTLQLSPQSARSLFRQLALILVPVRPKREA